VEVGSLLQYPTEALAWKQTGHLRLVANPENASSRAVTFGALADRYLAEEVPELRHSTGAAYTSYIDNSVKPKWGEYPISRVKAFPVEQWLKSLDLAPKTRGHIHNIMRVMFNSAMRWELIELGECFREQTAATVAFRESRVATASCSPVHEKSIVLELQNELIVAVNKKCTHRGRAKQIELQAVNQRRSERLFWIVARTLAPVDTQCEDIQDINWLERDAADDLHDRRTLKRRNFLTNDGHRVGGASVQVQRTRPLCKKQ